MQELYRHLHASLAHLTGFFILQGLILFVFAVLIIFYPFAAVILLAFLLMVLSLVSFYFAYRTIVIQRFMAEVKNKIIGVVKGRKS